MHPSDTQQQRFVLSRAPPVRPQPLLHHSAMLLSVADDEKTRLRVKEREREKRAKRAGKMSDFREGERRSLRTRVCVCCVRARVCVAMKREMEICL